MSKSQERGTPLQIMLLEREQLFKKESSSSQNLITGSGLNSHRDLSELFRRIESLTSELSLLSQSEELDNLEFSFVIANYRSFLNSLGSSFQDQGVDGVASTFLRTQIMILAKLGFNLSSDWR